jgi:hypothetical protein
MKKIIFSLAILGTSIISFSFIFNETKKKDCQWSSPIIRGCQLESTNFEKDGGISGRVRGICPKCQRISSFIYSFHFSKPTSQTTEKWWDKETCWNHKGEKEYPVSYEYSVHVTSICK